MSKKNQIFILISIQIIVLVCLCIYGSFLGAAKAKEFFASDIMAAFWALLALTLTAGIISLLISKRNIAAAFTALGILLILIGGVIGSEKIGEIIAPDDIEAGYMLIYEGQKQNRIHIDEKRTKTLPFYIALDSFEVDYYDNGRMPKSFVSNVRLIKGDKSSQPLKIEVNKPLYYGGHGFYQSSYDSEAGAYTLLSVRSNRGSGFVYVGFTVLMASMVVGLWLPNFKLLIRSGRDEN